MHFSKMAILYPIFRDYLCVSAMNERSSEMYLIELPAPKSVQVLQQFDFDYQRLTDFLDIKKNRLVILNPKKKLPVDEKRTNVDDG